ncbi:MAG: Sec-independent protein translocase protein TatB [Myxococcales bacterium]
MFGIGFGEMLIIAVILLIAVGPRQLPQLMKTVGKGMREVRRATNDLRRSTGIDELMRDDELRNPLKAETKPQRYVLRPSDRESESPSEGVDTAHARYQQEHGTRVAASGSPSPSDTSNEG